MPAPASSFRLLRVLALTFPMILACSSSDPTPPGGGGAGAGGSAGAGASGGSPPVGGGGSGQGGGSGGGGTANGGSGMAGVGGTAAGGGGAAGAAGGGAGTAGSGGSSAGFFEEDFEAGTVGMQPSGFDNFISYNKNAMNPNGMLLAVVDTTRAHGGTKSLHVKSDGAPVQLTKALMSGMNKLYVRVWVYMTRKLGQQTNNSANHETLIALRTKSGDVNDEIRFGEIKGTVGVNETPSDNITPTMDKWHQATGPVIPEATWTCVEVAFLADSSPNTLRSWKNGATLLDVTSVGADQWQNNSVSADWLAKKFAGAPPEVVIGWQSFSSAANELWFDDLVLGTSPIGCD